MIAPDINLIVIRMSCIRCGERHTYAVGEDKRISANFRCRKCKLLYRVTARFLTAGEPYKPLPGGVDLYLVWLCCVDLKMNGARLVEQGEPQELEVSCSKCGKAEALQFELTPVWEPDKEVF